MPLRHQRREQHAAEAAHPRQFPDLGSGIVSVSVIWTTSPSRTSSKGGNSPSGRGNDAFNASSAAGLVGVNAARWAMSSTKRNTAVEKPPISRLELVRDGLEHRLHVRRRTGDHLQDVGGRGLPLQRLLGLVEQPRVLDGDHRLVARRSRPARFRCRRRCWRVCRPSRAVPIEIAVAQHAACTRRVACGSLVARAALVVGRGRCRPIGRKAAFFSDDRALM